MSGYAKYTLNPLAYAVWGDHETTGFFTDAAAILNLVDLRSIVRCPGSNLSVFTRAFGQKENFNVYFSAKMRSFLHPNTAQLSFFLENLKKNWPEKPA